MITGSVAGTSYSRLSSTPVVAAAAPNPTSTPEPAKNSPRLTTSAATLDGRAPSLEEVTAPRQIQVPTLYFHGRNDGCIGAEIAEGMEAFFDRGLEKVIVEDAGHFVHQERPEEVNRRILEFLGAR